MLMKKLSLLSVVVLIILSSCQKTAVDMTEGAWNVVGGIYKEGEYLNDTIVIGNLQSSELAFLTTFLTHMYFENDFMSAEKGKVFLDENAEMLFFMKQLRVGNNVLVDSTGKAAKVPILCHSEFRAIGNWNLNDSILTIEWIPDSAKVSPSKLSPYNQREEFTILGLKDQEMNYQYISANWEAISRKKEGLKKGVDELFLEWLNQRTKFVYNAKEETWYCDIDGKNVPCLTRVKLKDPKESKGNDKK